MCNCFVFLLVFTCGFTICGWNLGFPFACLGVLIVLCIIFCSFVFVDLFYMCALCVFVYLLFLRACCLVC